jgi:hypothetical protein
MILLLGFSASLLCTFVISVAVLSVILTVTTANKAAGHPFRSHVAQLSKHEPHQLRGNSKIVRQKDKATSVVADAARGRWKRR